MTDWPNSDVLLERFRAWLEQVRDESQAAARNEPQPESDGATDGVAGEFGLVDVVREFTALRHEIKLQTKSGRGLEEQTTAAVAALEDASRQFRTVEPREAEAARRAALPLIESMADLDEALGRAQGVVESARERLVGESEDAAPRRLAEAYAAQPAWKRWLCRSWYDRASQLWQADAEDRKRTVNSVVDGYAMVRKRLERAMAKEDLYRMASVGLPVDPHTMTVVEVVDANGQVEGTVIEEIRPGYRWKERIVRFAEVRAARHKNQNPVAFEESR